MLACETLKHPPAVFVTVYASNARGACSRAACVRTRELVIYYIKESAVFGVSLVYQVHGQNRVVLFSRRTYIGAVAEAKIARSAVTEKSDVDRMRASAIASSIVTPQSFPSKRTREQTADVAGALWVSPLEPFKPRFPTLPNGQ